MSLQGSDHSSGGEGDAGTICSICLEVVGGDTRTRSNAKLRCGHEFHLDCICSAFNYTGIRRCPNCADIEESYWQFTNRRRRRRRQTSRSSQPENRPAEAHRHGNGIPWCSSCLFHHNGPCNQAVLRILMPRVYANEVHLFWGHPAPRSITVIVMNDADQSPPSSSIYDSTRTGGQFITPNLWYPPSNYRFQTNNVHQQHYQNHNSRGAAHGHVSSVRHGMPLRRRYQPFTSSPWWWSQ